MYIHLHRFVEVAATIFNGGNLSAAMLSSGQVRMRLCVYNSYLIQLLFYFRFTYGDTHLTRVLWYHMLLQDFNTLMMYSHLVLLLLQCGGLLTLV